MIATSIFYRRRRGRHIFARSPADCLFEENRTSGRELGGFRAVGGASNALKVCVTHHTLLILPCFPFSLMFLPEVWGLDHSIEVRRIDRIEERSGLFGHSQVVHLNDDRKIELRLRNPDGFKRAIDAAKAS